MSRLHSVVAVVMLVFWAPITSHCKLEFVPGLEFLICCTHEEAAPHQDSDCEGDSCQTVESGAYKIQDNRDLVPAPSLTALFFVPFIASGGSSPHAVVCGVLTAAPPELSQSWQFQCRAALPVRAPSLAS